mmetsp:Transcript_33432/g.104031  ORF Transcript_33432/g.104031 Transcript_33432/m.104031 type:complete len:261 (+) Transcript_33432:440-1222(+)
MACGLYSSSASSAATQAPGFFRSQATQAVKPLRTASSAVPLMPPSISKTAWVSAKTGTASMPCSTERPRRFMFVKTQALWRWWSMRLRPRASSGMRSPREPLLMSATRRPSERGVGGALVRRLPALRAGLAAGAASGSAGFAAGGLAAGAGAAVVVAGAGSAGLATVASPPAAAAGAEVVEAPAGRDASEAPLAGASAGGRLPPAGLRDRAAGGEGNASKLKNWSSSSCDAAGAGVANRLRRESASPASSICGNASKSKP